MSWNQLIQPNRTVKGRVGMCLEYVRIVFGQPAIERTALIGWNRAVYKHADRNHPTDVAVPLWWNWTSPADGINYGHVVWFDPTDGTYTSSPFATSTGWFIVKSIDAITNELKKYGSTSYLGWTEDISGGRVVQYAPEPTSKTQRVVGSTKTAYRKSPNRSDELIDWWDAGAICNFKGFVRGDSVDNNDIWFVGALTSGYSWSGGFTDSGTHDLPDLTPIPPVVVPPVIPPVEKPYTFTKDFDFVTEVVPAANGNFEYGNFPASPNSIVIHDFGEANVDTYQSVKNTFTKKGTEVSAHFVISKAKLSQFVSLKDRAYHAGPGGNNNYGIETDPAFKNDPVQIANIQKLTKALQELTQKKLGVHKHSEFMPTKCGDDVNLALYDIPYPIVIMPPEVDYSKENNDLLKWIVALLKKIFNQ